MTPEEQRRLARLERFAGLLDSAVTVPGTNVRIGLDPIVGLVPGVGDAVAALLSAAIVVEALRLGVPKWTLLRMLFNVALDVAVGSVPMVGDLFDVVWRANERNLSLLREALDADGSVAS